MNYNERQLLVQDLSDYLNISTEFVEAQITSVCSAYTNFDLKGIATQWIWMFGRAEGSSEQYNMFYATNFYYLFDLIGFAGCLDLNHANAQQFMHGKCLDYGCGIGTVGLAMINLPEVTEVYATDIGITLLDFLQWRIRKHEIGKIQVLDPMSSGRRNPHLGIGIDYDFIYARDVFEHAQNRVEIMYSLIAALKPGGVLCESSPIWNWLDPNNPYSHLEMTGCDISLKPYDIWDILRDAGFELVSEAPSPTFPGPLTTKCWRKPQ